MQSSHLQLVKQIADSFALLPQVEAVALSGSRGRGGGTSDSASDLDVYVYTRSAIPLAARHAIIEHTGGTTRSSLDLNYWGPSDVWLHAPTGIEIDISYFDAPWMEAQIAHVVEQHQASLGYTTGFWHIIRQSIVFSDPHAWFATLQQRCQVAYPESLRQNIIALNHPLLRSIIPAYATQLEKAAKRYDLVSINHRLAALLASYFDIIFAVNRLLHPGEKRLVEFALNHCQLLPANMETDITSLLLMTSEDIAGLSGRVTHLLDQLDQLLEAEGFESKRPNSVHPS
jgi:hypothetical protein